MILCNTPRGVPTQHCLGKAFHNIDAPLQTDWVAIGVIILVIP